MRSIRKGNKRYLRSTQKKERNGTTARDSNEDIDFNGRETNVDAKQANGSHSLMNFDVKRYVFCYFVETLRRCVAVQFICSIHNEHSMERFDLIVI
jgi:hypothetical protein